MSFLTKLFGSAEGRFLKSIEPVVQKINELELEFEKLSDDELKGKTFEFKKRIGVLPVTDPSLAWVKESLDDILPSAFALVREASKRTLKKRHFDVQLAGGIVLHQGKIAEMKTGEGKTLVATLPAYLNALEGKGVHIITVNDYLSRRDAVWMGQIYNTLGLSVSCLNHEASYIYDAGHVNSKIKNQNEKLDEVRDTTGSFHVVHEFLKPCSRKEVYSADITYGTNNEFGFDYLRDNLVYEAGQVCQTQHHYAIVDEIDSILIDEARTPLIISGPAEDAGEFYKMFAKIADKLQQEKDFTVDEKMKSISLTDEGINKAEKMLGVGDIYTEKGIKYVHHLETAVRAKALFHIDKEYVVKSAPSGGNEVIIVDESTGRMMPGRRWSEGLHQAIEAKEGVQIQKESRTLASITFQNYFRMYEKLSGMTGTAATSAEEFHKVYNLETVPMPTNKPSGRKDYADLVFQTEKGKWQAVTAKIKELNKKGQPVLVGTVSIEKNEKLSALLQREGIQHKVLNAKKHEEEGEVIAQAGRMGGVTIATNMAGRGVDVVLGGNPPVANDMNKVRELGGLFVLGTERHEARRIDNQLRGRAGRQGDAGETQFFVSLEDDLMRIFGAERIKSMMGKFGIPEDQPIESKLVSGAIESAQSKIEGFHFDARKHLLEYDDVMNKQRSAIYRKRKENLLGEAEQQIKMMSLQTIDMFWLEHLETMDYLRSSVRLRAYGQRDPLIEYKNEAIRLFRQLESSIDEKIEEMKEKISSQSAQAGQPSAVSYQPTPVLNVRHSVSNTSEVGRNDPCPCGSGKKYKKCCGK